MKKMIIGGLAAVAAAVGIVAAVPPHAHADADASTDYLRTLRSEGINADDATALYLGKVVCAGLATGMDDGEVVTLLRSKAYINRQQFSDAANGGRTAGGYCTLMAGWQNPKPSSIGDFVEGCAAAFAERGVK
jgi:hypothetical protein